MVIANINYLCIVYYLHAGIVGLIIFLKPGPEPRLWTSLCCKPSSSLIQSQQVGQAQTGKAWMGFGPSPALHYSFGSSKQTPQVAGLNLY